MEKSLVAEIEYLKTLRETVLSSEGLKKLPPLMNVFVPSLAQSDMTDTEQFLLLRRMAALITDFMRDQPYFEKKGNEYPLRTIWVSEEMYFIEFLEKSKLSNLVCIVDRKLTYAREFDDEFKWYISGLLPMDTGLIAD